MAKSRRRRSSSDRSKPAGDIGRDHWRSDGREKTRFRTAEEANRAAFGVRLDSGGDLHPYACRWCGGWHLGSRGTDR